MAWQAWFSMVRLAITIVGLSWPASSIQCKTGWHKWHQACYKVSTKQIKASDASALCKQDGANLASIHSVQENEFLRNLSGGIEGEKEVFIGLSDTQIEGTFVWSDASTVVYTNWEDGEPNNDNGIGDCVILLAANGKWNDTPCQMWYEFVCKFTNAQLPQGQDRNVMSKEQSMIIYEQKTLAYHVFYKQFTSSLIHCALLCANEPSCKSINFKSEGGKDAGECQLNDAIAKDFPLHLMQSLDSTYSVPYGLG